MHMEVASRSSVAVSSVVSVAGVTTPVQASPNDYAFEPVSVQVRTGWDSEFAVRTVHRPTRKLVAGAMLVHTRRDMSPSGIETMTANHAALPSSEPGVYRFRADLTMAGGWILRQMTNVPGESETVQGTVVFRAT